MLQKINNLMFGAELFTTVFDALLVVSYNLVRDHSEWFVPNGTYGFYEYLALIERQATVLNIISGFIFVCTLLVMLIGIVAIVTNTVELVKGLIVLRKAYKSRA